MSRTARLALALPLITLPFLAAAPASAAPASLRWTDGTPDAMLDRAVERATADGATEADAIAATMEIAHLSDRATYGKSDEALARIADRAPGEARIEARLVARALAADEGMEAGTRADRALGVITDLAILGPFRDTGGGLAAKEGPEAPGATFADMRARYSWGTVDVGWRAVPPAFAWASGAPLDLFVHPRQESCSYVATKITLAAAQAVVVRLAATGQARLSFDGVEVAKSEDVHGSAWLDRLAARVEATAGAHLISAKVCTGALGDDGRVRLRVVDDKGAALTPYAASADLRGWVKPPKNAKSAKVTAVETPLARALAPKDSLASQLDASIVRTLGGTDDKKSPRAPGMLDAITHRKDATPDALAMAGWIAPSGANRSGWLNDARAKAEAAGDGRSAAFATRRLAAERLGARMPDWAMATLNGASVEGDDEATLLHALVDEALGTDALRSRAQRALSGVFAKSKTRAPTTIVTELAQLARSSDPALARTALEELARRGLKSDALVDGEATRDSKSASDAAAAAFAGSVSSADEGLAIAQTVARTGAHDVARRLYATLVEWAPNRQEAWGGLADEISASTGAHDDAAVLAALRRARELAPGEARFREELALRTPTGAAEEARADEKHLVPSQTILARRQGVPTGVPDVADRELHWLRAVVMHPDHRVSMLIHYAREIVIAPRTEGELYEQFPFETDLVEIVRARVHRKEGGIAFPSEEHNEGTRPRIRWPELRPGDVVEVAIREWTARAIGGRGDSPFYFLDYAGAPATHPLLYNEVDVETLPDRPLYVSVVRGGAYDRTEKDENGRHVVRLVWNKPPTYADEPFSPHETEIVPVIIGSTFRSWADFRAWYAEAVRGFTEPDEEVRRLARELTKGKTTRDAKLRAIFDFVSDDIRYVNYTSGEWWLPNRPQQLLARREGDCDDKAMLLITLLKSVGIDAQEVMVQTRLTGEPSVLLAKDAAAPLFDHGIAFLPGPNGGTYLDATSPQSRLGPLPSMDARAVALRLDAGPAEIVRLPSSSPADHGANVAWTLTLHPDGSADLVGEETHVGDGAFWLRTSLSQPDARRNYVESSLVGEWLPTVEVDPKIDFKGDLPNGQAKVSYRAKSLGYARREQGELVVSIARTQTLASLIAPLPTRTLPVELPPSLAPSHETRTVRLVAPQGWTWSDLPEGGDADGGELGKAHVAIARDPKDARVVVVTRSVSFDLASIPVEKYAAWRTWVQRVDAVMNKQLRLVESGSRGAK